MAADDIASRRAVLALAGLTGAAGALGAERAIGQSPPARAPTIPAPTAIDPRTYGAKVDGVTDNSAALRDAAAAGRAIMIEGQMRIEQVVDLPAGVALLGAGVYRSLLTLGPRGKLRVQGNSFARRSGGGTIRDLTIRPADRANAEPGLELRHVEHFLFDNVTFYRLAVVLDDHHFVAFRDCRFFGDDTRAGLLSNCASQPDGHVAISEAPRFAGCHFSSNPVTLEDTVDARFTDCVFFAGSWGVRSTRRLALGTDAQPFFMGPSVSGCVFDSIDGPAIEIDGGGTDCRITDNYISAGRRASRPGVRLAGCSAVELVGNRFEWCGVGGLELDRCERIGVVANSFGNMASGAAIRARGSREVRVVANAFENRARWGGSGAGNTEPRDRRRSGQQRLGGDGEHRHGAARSSRLGPSQLARGGEWGLASRHRARLARRAERRASRRRGGRVSLVRSNARALAPLARRQRAVARRRRDAGLSRPLP